MAQMALRAVAMAREAPEDPTAGLADPAQLARDWDVAALELADPAAEPSPANLEQGALAAETKTDLAEFAWDVNTGEVILFTTSDSVVERITTHFESTFDMRLPSRSRMARMVQPPRKMPICPRGGRTRQ